MIDREKCLSCMKITRENYGNMQEHPCLKCMEEEKLAEYRTPLVCVSGGFDPAHVGHLRYIQAAAKYGDVVVILNSDDWLKRKKGYFFMPFEQRKEMLEGIVGVKHVVAVDDSDGTVIKALREIRPDYFANGGDRIDGNTPEKEVCETLGITMLWGVGGEFKANSSSQLVANSWEKLVEGLG